MFFFQLKALLLENTKALRWDYNGKYLIKIDFYWKITPNFDGYK
jgi:hypothetical protein